MVPVYIFSLFFGLFFHSVSSIRESLRVRKPKSAANGIIGVSGKGHYNITGIPVEHDICFIGVFLKYCRFSFLPRSDKIRHVQGGMAIN